VSDAPDPSTAYHWHIDDALAALGSHAQDGLNDEVGRARLQQYGRNELTAEKPVPA
jgi:Ca2+-transporting ATPase